MTTLTVRKPVRKTRTRKGSSKTPDRILLWKGPSQLNGKPIMVVATGFKRSKNEKTGNMLQTWVLSDEDNPLNAVKSGAAQSVCGHCPLGGRLQPDGTYKLGVCYINLIQGPQNVYRAIQQGSYERLNRRRHARFFQGRPIRFGSYGDPVAAPLELWEWLASLASHHTGYTHQFRHCSPAYGRLLMASCETEADRVCAHNLGYRTFRVRHTEQPLLPGEIICPASEEAGKVRTCENCRACHGNPSGQPGRADVAIIAHGLKWKQDLFQIDFGG